MRRKNKAKAASAKPSAAQVAKLAQLSIARVYRLRQEGRPDDEIIRQAQQRRESLLLRSMPVTEAGTNGHAAAPAWSYSVSLAKKEAAIAQLREIELLERRGELVPTAHVKLFIGKFFTEAKDILLAGPGQMADALAGENDPRQCQVIVERWLERALGRLAEAGKFWEAPKEAA